MATAVQIVIEVDEKGAVQGVQRVSSAFDSVGSSATSGAAKAGEGFKKMEAAEKKAHDTLQLISGTIGVQIPRDVEKVISKMPGLSSALSAGFKVGAILGVAAAVAQIVDNFDLLEKKAVDVGLKFQAIFNKDVRDTLNNLKTDKALEPVVDQLNNIKRAAEVAGTEGVAQQKAQLKANLEQLDEFKDKYLKAQRDTYLSDSDQYKSIEEQTNAFVRQAKILAEKTTNEDVALLRKQALRTAAQDRLQAEASAARGEESIELELAARKKQIALDEKLKGVKLNDEVIAAEVQHNRAIADLRRSASDDIYQSEQKAALESVSSWDRADAQILADFGARNREINRQLRDTVINSQEADRLREANWKETNARMSQQYAQDFQSLYDDITSGNIGKRIKQNMEKFFFDLAGRWYGAIFGSRQNSNSGLGFLGALLGIGGFGAAVPQYGTASVSSGGVPIAGGSSNDFGSPNAAASLLSLGGFGSVNGFGGGGLSSVLAGTGGVSGAIGGLLNGSLNTPSVSDTGATAATSSGSSGLGRLGSGISSIFSVKGLSNLLPTAIGLAGSSIGGPVGSALSVLGIGALLSKSGGAFLSGLAPLAAPLAAGLLGFGVGAAHGPVAGALSGAGTGLAAGLAAPLLFGAALSPATFGLSIIIGALAGLFGGLFGGNKRKKQAEQLAQQVNSQITQIEAGFKGFSIDYASAITGLENIRTQSYPSFDQLKGEGRGVWQNSVLPKLNSVEQEINGIQSERGRRSSLLFGPPQFATGGQFRLGNGGQGVAILDDGEVVMGKDAVRTYGAKNLLAMNNAARSGNAASVGGGDSVVIHAVDARSFEDMLKRHGWKAIRTMARRDRLEGRGRL